LGPKIVIHYTGHRVSGEGLHTSFPAEKEKNVTEKIAEVIAELDVVAAFGSLAAGADILFAEEFFRRAVSFHIVLPFGIDEFKKTSVAPSGAPWLDRFDGLILHANTLEMLSGSPPLNTSYERCTTYAMRQALRIAQEVGAIPLQIAVWNGVSGGAIAGTSADVAHWHKLGFGTKIIGV
jgi:hypothetical protein